MLLMATTKEAEESGITASVSRVNLLAGRCAIATASMLSTQVVFQYILVCALMPCVA